MAARRKLLHVYCAMQASTMYPSLACGSLSCLGPLGPVGSVGAWLLQYRLSDGGISTEPANQSNNRMETKPRDVVYHAIIGLSQFPEAMADHHRWSLPAC